jgi:protein kinase-like protein
VASDPLIGRTIAGYRIEACIGRGGMSRVYRAEHIRLGRRDALKLLSVELIADGSFRERFEREWRVAAAIEHPNIIPVFDAGEADGHFYIAMRYIETTDLRALLERDGRLDAGRAANILRQAASALDAAHLHGLVHRDVKPGNILVAAGDHVFLSDFGLAKLTAADKGLTRTGYFIGTVDYAAPEQIRGNESLDARTDVYGLGCVAYECLSGARPYERESDAKLMYAHLQDPPPRITVVRPDVPAALDDILGKALAKAREDRYATCGALAAAITASLTEERGRERGAVRAPPTVPTGRTGDRTPLFRRPGVLLAAASSLTTIAIVVAIAVLGGGSGSDGAGNGPSRPQAIPPAFADSFTDPSRGWYRYESRAVRLGYAGGAYEFLIKVPNWRAHADTAFAPSASEFGDVTVAVDAVKRGTSPGAYGVLCRKTGSSRFYALEIGSNGVAQIAKVGPGEFALLGKGRSKRPGPSARVQGSCVGGRGKRPAVLTLTVDGRRALTARDARKPYAAGAVGLVVESFDRGSVRVAFDDLVVRHVRA